MIRPGTARSEILVLPCIASHRHCAALRCSAPASPALRTEELRFKHRPRPPPQETSGIAIACLVLLDAELQLSFQPSQESHVSHPSCPRTAAATSDAHAARRFRPLKRTHPRSKKDERAPLPPNFPILPSAATTIRCYILEPPTYRTYLTSTTTRYPTPSPRTILTSTSLPGLLNLNKTDNERETCPVNSKNHRSNRRSASPLILPKSPNSRASFSVRVPALPAVCLKPRPVRRQSTTPEASLDRRRFRPCATTFDGPRQRGIRRSLGRILFG